MYTKTKMPPSIADYSIKIGNVAQLIQNAERIVIGIGAGLSAAGGLNYTDPALLHKWYPEYEEMGFNSFWEVASAYWWFDQTTPEKYWSYWARHINNIYYQTGTLRPYQSLYQLLDGRNYFVSSTNGDGQMEKAGFPRERIFSAQGHYSKLQCKTPCSNDLYDNHDMIDTMITNMPNKFEVRPKDIPHCPRCGEYLVPNLRIDDHFVQEPYLKTLPDYEAYLQDCCDKRTVLLELGVGFNTPVIIRYPFEQITSVYERANLIRVNLSDAGVPVEIADKSISLQVDIAMVLEDLAEQLN